MRQIYYEFSCKFMKIKTDIQFPQHEVGATVHATEENKSKLMI